MDQAAEWKRANRKRKNDDLTADELAERQARKHIKMEEVTEYPEGVEEVVDENEVEIIKEKKSKKKKKDKKAKEEPADDYEPQAEVEPMAKEEGVIEEEASAENNDGNEENVQKVKSAYSKDNIVKLMSFDECKRMHSENPNCGMVILVEKRHFALSYHLLGGNVMKSINYILNNSVGKYRSAVKGVVIAIQGAKLISNPRVVDDHSVFHCYANIKQAVFQPVMNHNYECVVKLISHDYISALVLGAISITMPRDNNFEDCLNGIQLDVGDTISAKYTSITINRGLCSLRGTFVKILKKTQKKEIKPEISMSGKKMNTTTKFTDTDDEFENE